MADASLLEAARFERDYCRDNAASRIRAGLADPHSATVDYQCWVALAEWLETGRFFGFYGGASPEEPNAPWVSWPALETAAQAALTGVTTQIDRMERAAAAGPEAFGELRRRRSCLFAIHRKVQLRRQSIDAINAEFRAEGREEIAA